MLATKLFWIVAMVSFTLTPATAGQDDQQSCMRCDTGCNRGPRIPLTYDGQAFHTKQRDGLFSALVPRDTTVLSFKLTNARTDKSFQGVYEVDFARAGPSYFYLNGNDHCVVRLKEPDAVQRVQIFRQ